MPNCYRSPCTQLRTPQRRTGVCSWKTMQPGHIEGTVHGGSNRNVVPACIWVNSAIAVNGVNQNVPPPTATSYTLETDCTGTKTVLPYGPHFNIFVAVDGESLTATATDSGFAVSESDSRVQRSH